MRLIDADELKKAIPDVEPDMFEYCGRCKLLDKEDIEDLIDKQPTVEAMPVSHAHWRYAWEYSKGSVHSCSKCGALVYNPTLFCPYCGREMDEKTE